MTQPPKPRSSGNVALFVGLALLAFLLWLAPKRPEPPAEEPMLTAAQRGDCAEVISAVTAEGLVRARPAPNRVNVDELRWAALPAEQRTALLAAVGCDAFGKRFASYSLGEATVAYGYRSGKRLAMLTSAGPAFE